MSASRLSAETLAAHNRHLLERRATAPPNSYRRQHKKTLPHPKDGLYRQSTDIPHRDMASDRESQKSSSLAEKSNSGRHSLASHPHGSKRRVGKWRHGKYCSISVNGRDRTKPVHCENTYKMGPETTEKFSTSTTKREVDMVIEERFKDLSAYDSIKCAVLCRTTSEAIKTRIKTLGFNRYKIVAHVVVGFNQGQGVNVASQGVWDVDKDNMISTVYEKNDFFVVATVFGTYFE